MGVFVGLLVSQGVRFINLDNWVNVLAATLGASVGA